MMMMDVTFRESVLCQNRIDISKVLETIRVLSQTYVDYIEIGYMKAGENGDPLWTYSPDYIRTCNEICKGKTKLAIMIHPEDFSPKLYDPEIIKMISLVRITSKPENFSLTQDIVMFFKDHGIQTSINLLRGSNFTDEETLTYCNSALDFGADFFYVADSNGNLLPEEVRSRIKTLKAHSNIKIGFHAHNNLGLAIVNSMEAVKAGADIIDGSLLGYGKGAGNLRTELFPLVLNRIGMTYSIDVFNKLFNVVQYFFHQVVKQNPIEEQYKFSLYGLFNINLDFDKWITTISQNTNIKDSELVFKYLNESGGDTDMLYKLVEDSAMKNM